MKKTLRLVLGDQLNAAHSWFQNTDQNVYYVLMEVREETDYVRHHIQKVAAIFLAMRSFAKELRLLGHQVIYFTLDDPKNQQAVGKNIQNLIEQHNFDQFEYQLPDEHRVDAYMKNLRLSIPVYSADTEHFLTTRNELALFFKGKKSLLMESFYRHMRKKGNWLMNGSEPEGGRWNYDSENRQKYIPGKHAPFQVLTFKNEVSEIMALMDRAGIQTIGEYSENLDWPINRAQSLELLEHFCLHLLAQFGNFQDAMIKNEAHLFHSRLSFAMNCKLLAPAEIVKRVIAEWEKRKTEISMAQVEGFVRQIIGWREYMRGVYWMQMPEYQQLNFFENTRKLPAMFWTGQTRMQCLSQTINQSLKTAYAHHIQRLMITGNFSLLMETHPNEVDQWYLGIYADAFEWVQITNTRGMSQFADGGIVGTKPYVSSAAYIHKMSNYCEGCFYKKDQKVGDRACPFNSLYWNFYDRNREKLERNPRIGMMYTTWDRWSAEEKAAIIKQAQQYLELRDEI